jgi:hypothetical protein
MGPIVIINSVFQTLKQSDLRPWCPHYMRLHGWWQILNLCHRDGASERGKISLNSSQNPLRLTGWKLSSCCWSPYDSRCNPWSRMTPVPHIIHRSLRSHICTQYTRICQILWYKKMIYKKKQHKNDICFKKKMMQTYPSHLAPRLEVQGYRDLSRNQS